MLLKLYMVTFMRRPGIPAVAAGLHLKPSFSHHTAARPGSQTAATPILHGLLSYATMRPNAQEQCRSVVSATVKRLGRGRPQGSAVAYKGMLLQF